MSLRVVKASRLVLSRNAALTIQRRNAQTVPRLGTPAEMQAEQVEQIRARIAYQKELAKHHHSLEEEVNEMYRWINLTFYVAFPVCAASLFYTVFFDEHSHRLEGELPEYMSFRAREFPWECSDCDLFNGKCWEECRAEKKK